MMAPSAVSKKRPKLRVQLRMPCTAMDMYLVLEMSRSAHCTMMIVMKYAVCAYISDDMSKHWSSSRPSPSTMVHALKMVEKSGWAAQNARRSILLVHSAFSNKPA